MRDFNFDMIYGDQSDGSQIISFANSLPMMAERRVVIVKSVQKLSVKSKDVLLSYVNDPLLSTCLVLTAQQIDKRQSFYSKLIKKAVFIMNDF